MQDLMDTVQPYWCFCDELAILNAISVKGSCVVVLSALRADLPGEHGGTMIKGGVQDSYHIAVPVLLH